MSTLPDTIFLNPETWDLDIDAKGCIAIASTPWAQAQNAASACRVWLGECALNTTVGVPYEQAVLGYRPSLSQIGGWFETAAESAVGVAQAVPILQYGGNATRGVTGQIQLTLSDGTNLDVAI